jgi:hypothetical protein
MHFLALDSVCSHRLECRGGVVLCYKELEVRVRLCCGGECWCFVGVNGWEAVLAVACMGRVWNEGGSMGYVVYSQARGAGVRGNHGCRDGIEGESVGGFQAPNSSSAQERNRITITITIKQTTSVKYFLIFSLHNP